MAGTDADFSSLVGLVGDIKLAEGSFPVCSAKESFATARFSCLSSSMDRSLESPSVRRNRLTYLLWVGLAIAAGLLWRSRFVSLPPFLSKYGGDALWASLVFFGFCLVLREMPTLRLACVSLGFAWAIEFLQLYHAPWIDSIRSARIGHLILGSTFNWPDLPAYAVGVVIGALVDGALLKRSGQRRS